MLPNVPRFYLIYLSSLALDYLIKLPLIMPHYWLPNFIKRICSPPWTSKNPNHSLKFSGCDRVQKPFKIFQNLHAKMFHVRCTKSIVVYLSFIPLFKISVNEIIDEHRSMSFIVQERKRIENAELILKNMKLLEVN